MRKRNPNIAAVINAQADNERNFLKRIVSAHGVRSRSQWDIGRNEAPRGWVGTQRHAASHSQNVRTLHPLCIDQVSMSFLTWSSVALLDHALELIALTGNPVQIVVREIAPLFLDLSLNCFQFPSTQFQSIFSSGAVGLVNSAGPPPFLGEAGQTVVSGYLVGRLPAVNGIFRTGFVRR